MPPQDRPEPDTRAVLELLDSLIMHQREKCLAIARRLNPHLTPDDIMISWDWPELNSHPQYMWEDGIAAGLETAHAAIAAAFREPDADYRVRRFRTDKD